MSKLTDLMNAAFPIPKTKLNLAVFLFNWTDVLSCYNVFNCPIPPVERGEAPESISNVLNSMSLYYKSVNELKI